MQYIFCLLIETELEGTYNSNSDDLTDTQSAQYSNQPSRGSTRQPVPMELLAPNQEEGNSYLDPMC